MQLLSIWHFAHTYTCNSKSKGRIWTFYLLSETSIFCVRAGCEIWMVNYSSKHALQSFSNKHTYMHNLKTSGHIWRFSILNDCYIIRVILCVVWGCMIDLTGGLLLRTHICRSPIHCVRILQDHTYIAIWCTITHDNKTHVPMTAYSIPKDGFTAKDASFYKNKAG